MLNNEWENIIEVNALYLIVAFLATNLTLYLTFGTLELTIFIEDLLIANNNLLFH